MSPLLHHAKEFAERLSGRHLLFSRAFPYVHAERRFLSVRMDLHNKCNIRCRMCPFALEEVWNGPRVELSDAAIERLEREVWPRTRELWLSCSSEPLIGRKLKGVLARAKAAGIPHIQMVTNGMALSEDKARMLIQNGLDRLNVSLDGATAGTYEAIRAFSNFERVVANVRRLKALRTELGSATPALTVRLVMMLLNLPEWAAVVRLAADLGADRVILQPQTQYTEFGTQNSLSDHRAEVNAALDEAAAAARERGVALEAPGKFGDSPERGLEWPTARMNWCRYPWMQLVIYPDGQVTPCIQLFSHAEFGNLEHEGFDRIFYGPAFRRLREELRSNRLGPVCRGCGSGQVDTFSEDLIEKLQRRS